jgi:hypothetical protein
MTQRRRIGIERVPIRFGTTQVSDMCSLQVLCELRCCGGPPALHPQNDCGHRKD